MTIYAMLFSLFLLQFVLSAVIILTGEYIIIAGKRYRIR